MKSDKPDTEKKRYSFRFMVVIDDDRPLDKINITDFRDKLALFMFDELHTKVRRVIFVEMEKR